MGILFCVVQCILVAVVSVPVRAQATASYACGRGADKYRFCDQALSIETRVADVIASLTTEEKIGLLINDAADVPRLGIPKYEWWSEALHGVAYSPGVSFGPTILRATSFPQPILTSSSFNASLFNKIGQVISEEARAFHNAGQSGLTYWTPNINLFRDPRWGRGQETPGEDPYLTSVYAEYFVRGLQEEGDYTGDESRPALAPAKLKVSACCKHFAAYDLDAWKGVERYSFNAVVSAQDLEDSFNPPFEACIRHGRASGLMCSYNAVNGVPSCADKDLLTTIARETWDFYGYIVSDCDAVQNVYVDHNYTSNAQSAVAMVLKAGMDVNCGYTLSNYTASALERKLISEAEIDRALSHSFTVQFRLGVFDGHPGSQRYGALGARNVCTDEHQKLALEAAQQGIVLLKNDNNVLPFSRQSIQNLAVVGPNANDSLQTMLGNYAGNPCKYVSPLQGLGAYSVVHHVVGCRNNTSCDTVDMEAATGAAAMADATIIVVGLGLEQEREAFDRTSLLLPGEQQKLVLSVARHAKGCVVLVVMSGGPVDISFARDQEKIGAILWVGYPGQAGGEALAQIIFGDINPGGKLSMTWYPEALTSWPMTIMGMRPNSSGYPGRTYRFYTGEAVYNFGHGISYSNFVHSLHISSQASSSTTKSLVAPSAIQLLCYQDKTHCTDEDVRFCHVLEFTAQVQVANIHWRTGTDVVLLFVSLPGAAAEAGSELGLPLKQLVGFQRVNIAGNDTARVHFRVRPCRHFATTHANGTRGILEGMHTLSTSGGAVLSVEFIRG